MTSRDLKKPKGGYALVSNQGPFRETVVGCFKTHEAAVTEMRKYWSTVDTKGRRGLCGGIYNHGKEGKDDWSIHT